MPKEGGVERRSFSLPSFHILSCETLFLRGFKGDDDENLIVFPNEGAFDYSGYALSLRTHTSAILFFL